MSMDELLNDICVNTQSSIRIACPNGPVIYSDPFQIREDSHDADLILITHDHYDHFDPDSIERVRKSTTVFVVPEKLKKETEKYASSKENLIAVQPGMSFEVSGIPVETVPAYNIGKPFHPKRAGWVGYILTIDGCRIYLAGDTDLTPEIQEIHCDMAMVPIGGTFTMDAKEAAELVNRIHPRTAIPIHYGSIVGKKADAEVFRKHVDSDVEVVLKL
jgi:L-ascorbate metabolism protein UlaG (beta-lactamase superfamily)